MNNKKVVFVEGDGVEIRIRLANAHTVDQAGSHNKVFTPFAIDDPQQGVIEAEDGTISVSLGDRMNPANQVSWNNAHVQLLNLLLDGHVRGSDGSFEIYVGLKSGIHNKGSVEVRAFDLFWKNASETATYNDFPSLLSDRFSLRRKESFQLAWALVRASHLAEWDTVETLIHSASQLVSLSAKDKKTKQGALHQQYFEGNFRALLEQTLERLKSSRYP